MMKALRSGKLLPLFAALSAAIIIAGIVIFAVFGFNTASEKPKQQTLTVEYNVLIELEDKEAALQTVCEDAFKANGLSGWVKEVVPVMSSDSLIETSDSVLIYTFTNADPALLAKARDTINASQDFGEAVFHAEVRTLTQKSVDPDSAWRGAIGLALGAVVALFYVGVRFGVACGVGGFVCCVHDALFTAALFAVCRIPVYAAAPLLYAAVAAAVSAILWTLSCIKLREYKKSPEFGTGSVTGDEAIKENAFKAWKIVVPVAGVIALAFAVVGAVAANGVRLWALPMLLPVAVAVYSVFLIGPFVAALIQKSIDARKAKKQGGYKGKKKAPQA